MSDSRNLINVTIDASGKYAANICGGKYSSTDIANLLQYLASDSFINQLTNSILANSDPKTLSKMAQIIIANTINNTQATKSTEENRKLSRGLSPYFNPVINIRTSDDNPAGF